MDNKLNCEERAAPRVLLTDTNRWPVSSRVAIGLAEAGCEVAALCLSPGHPLRKTRAVREIFAYSGLRPIEALERAIRATNPQLVVPCDDRGVGHLHQLHARARSQSTAAGDALAALIERSLGPPESYLITSARYDLLRIAREEGLRVPHTRLIATVEELRSWAAMQAFPWVLKADGTFGGCGVRIAHTQAQAEKFFFEIKNLFGPSRAIKRLCIDRDPFWLGPWWSGFNPAVIAQSHIQGRPANCAVVCWQGRVLAGIGVEVLSAEGLTGPASVVRVVDSQEMMLAAERIAARLKLSGFFGLDFMIEAATGATYLIEMNPRCTPLCHLQLGAGRDLMGALTAQLSGQAMPERAPITRNDRIAYFPQAWAWKSEFLDSSFQDIPQGEPDLIDELLQPWPERRLLFRVSSLVRTAIGYTAMVRRSSTNLARKQNLREARQAAMMAATGGTSQK